MKLKKFFRVITFILIITLITGTIPVSAASSKLSLSKKSKILYIGGAKGVSKEGAEASTKSSYRVTKLINGYKKDSMYIKLRAEDTTFVKVKDSKNKIYAKNKVGSTKVFISVYNSKDNSLKTESAAGKCGFTSRMTCAYYGNIHIKFYSGTFQIHFICPYRIWRRSHLQDRHRSLLLL